MGRRGVLTLLLAAFVALLTLPTIAQAQTLMPVYRFYNTRQGVHFYTASEAEKNNVQAHLSSTYRYDGVGYSIDTSDAVNSSPLHRFYNVKKGVHFYTASEAEKNNVQAHLSSTYRYEGVAYNISLTPTSMPIHRFYNVKTGAHFYTATEGEKNYVIKHSGYTWRYEGVGFYITGSVPPWSPPPPPWDPTLPQKYRRVKIDGVRTSAKVIAMDFDDGPINSNTIVDIFAKYGGTPTLFWVGSRITSAPAEYAVAHGVEIANHSWGHKDLTTISYASQLNQINWADTRIAQFTDQKPLWFRAPFNAADSGVLDLVASTQHLYAHQYVITRDYQGIPASDLVKIFDNPKPGAIYLFHEGRSNTVAALPTILTNLRKKGFTVVSNTELLKYGAPSASLGPASATVMSFTGAPEGMTDWE
jgi:peptidoglycan/xylan/chitin deacetylase (PgdA/CDA1 family)